MTKLASYCRLLVLWELSTCGCFLQTPPPPQFSVVLNSYSAVIEHTNRVIFLEDDDVAAVVDGRLSIHRIKRTAGDHPGRAVQTLQMELQQIMKGMSLEDGALHCHTLGLLSST